MFPKVCEEHCYRSVIAYYIVTIGVAELVSLELYANVWDCYKLNLEQRSTRWCRHGSAKLSGSLRNITFDNLAFDLRSNLAESRNLGTPPASEQTKDGHMGRFLHYLRSILTHNSAQLVWSTSSNGCCRGAVVLVVGALWSRPRFPQVGKPRSPWGQAVEPA